jgi:hypothetical protein
MIDPELSEHAETVTAKTLRQFALMCLVFFGAIAVWQYLHARPTRAIVAGALAVVLGGTGLLKPEAIRPLFQFLMWVTRPIGVIMTKLILRIAYYGLFTPLALWFKLTKRDSLGRARESGDTHWQKRTDRRDPRRYLRQA